MKQKHYAQVIDTDIEDFAQECIKATEHHSLSGVQGYLN